MSILFLIRINRVSSASAFLLQESNTESCRDVPSNLLSTSSDLVKQSISQESIHLVIVSVTVTAVSSKPKVSSVVEKGADLEAGRLTLAFVTLRDKFRPLDQKSRGSLRRNPVVSTGVSDGQCEALIERLLTRRET